MNRCKRDMTRDQFNAALRRHDMQKVLAWIEIPAGFSVGMVLINGKFNRRASLARAIREQNAAEAKAELKT